MVLKFQKAAFYKVVLYVLLLDLVLGGSGHIVSFGPLSFRYVIFLFVGLIELYLLFKGGVTTNKASLLTMFFLAFVTIRAMFSLFVNDTGHVIDEFLGYLPLLLFFFFGYCFRRNRVGINDVKHVFVLSSFLLGLFSIIIWAVAFLKGPMVYQSIEVGFLRRYDIGRLAFSGSLVRLFMKGTVFCAISFIFSFYEWICGHRSKGSLVVMIVNFVAVIISFTLGLYISVVIGVVLVYLFFGNGKKRIRMILLLTLSIVVAVFFAIRLGIIDLMAERFSGEYTLSFKYVQTKALLHDMLNSPLFGNGSGHELTIDYGFSVISGYRTENMWGEMLNHYGLVGTSLFLLMIVFTFGNLWNKTKNSANANFVLFAIGIVMLAVESLSNPFLNNSIGLTYLAMCIGMTQARSGSLLVLERGIDNA